MQKRSKALTVMLEPAFYEILKGTHGHEGLSIWVHDLILHHMIDEGTMDAQIYLDTILKQEQEGAIPPM